MPRTGSRPAPDLERRLLPLDEVQVLLGGVSRAHLYVLFSDGRLRRTKLGRRTFVASDELARYIAELIVV